MNVYKAKNKNGTFNFISVTNFLLIFIMTKNVEQKYREGSSFVDFAKNYQETNTSRVLDYGENPHQTAVFYGDFDEYVEQLHGKAISYTNLIDIDAAVKLIAEFQNEQVIFAILKHANACGVAIRPDSLEAWKTALASDPVSALGGIIITNSLLTEETAREIIKISYDIVIAPDFENEAVELFKSNSDAIILKQKNRFVANEIEFRTFLNGIVVQDSDKKLQPTEGFKTVTKLSPTENQYRDLILANKIVKHTHTSSISIVKNLQLVANGMGQTSRVDALREAIHKAEGFGFDLEGAVLASEAAFPFPDIVHIANNVGIKTIMQPGGMPQDNVSIDFCNKAGMAMVFTNLRHFRH